MLRRFLPNGNFHDKGDWFEVGTTDGSATTTYQLPTNGNTMSSGSYLPGVYVHDGEAGDTDANYEFYPSVGACSGVGCIATDAVRGKVTSLSRLRASRSARTCRPSIYLDVLPSN